MSRIYGIGTDICDIRRIRAAWDRHGERFAQRILSDAEMQVFRARSARWPDHAAISGKPRTAGRPSAASSRPSSMGCRSPCPALPAR